MYVPPTYTEACKHNMSMAPYIKNLRTKTSVSPYTEAYIQNMSVPSYTEAYKQNISVLYLPTMKLAMAKIP